jgi:hypothetical protein
MTPLARGVGQKWFFGHNFESIQLFFVLFLRLFCVIYTQVSWKRNFEINHSKLEKMKIFFYSQLWFFQILSSTKLAYKFRKTNAKNRTKKSCISMLFYVYFYIRKGTLTCNPRFHEKKLKRKKKHQKPRKLKKWTNWLKVDFGIWTAPRQDSSTVYLPLCHPRHNNDRRFCRRIICTFATHSRSWPTHRLFRYQAYIIKMFWKPWWFFSALGFLSCANPEKREINYKNRMEYTGNWENLPFTFFYIFLMAGS